MKSPEGVAVDDYPTVVAWSVLMPAAIGAAVIGELALGATAELVVGYAVLSVGFYGANYAAQALLGSEKRADQQVTVQGSRWQRAARVLGQVKVGGVIVALETLKYNDTNKILYRAAVHCVGGSRSSSIGSATSKPGSVGPGGTVPVAVYQGKVVIEGHIGTRINRPRRLCCSCRTGTPACS